MIESRYSIEYIDPSSKKSSSKLGRLFIYSILTISILIAIAALAYNNLPNNTPQLITNKVQQFIASFNKPSTSPPTKKAITSKSAPTKTKEENTQDKDELIRKALSAAEIEDKYRKEIERLSLENTNQHDEAVKQLTENQTLAKKIEMLSSQLKNETQKSTKLEEEIVSLQVENKSISSLLKITEEMANSYSDEINKLEQQQKIVEEPTMLVSPSIKPSKIENAKLEIVKTTKKTPDLEVNISTDTNSEKTPSQIDAIVAAMEAAKNSSKENKTSINDSIVE